MYVERVDNVVSRDLDMEIDVIWGKFWEYRIVIFVHRCKKLYLWYEKSEF